MTYYDRERGEALRPSYTERKFASRCFELVFSCVVATPVRIRISVAGHKTSQSIAALRSVWTEL